MRQLQEKGYTKAKAEQKIAQMIISGQSPAGCDPANSLIPSRRQVEILRRVKANGFDLVGHGDGLSNSEWIKAIPSKVVFADDNMRAKFDDQMARATRLLAEMRKVGITTVRTMDGHGRFLWCFLKAVKNAGLDPDDYTIEFYDLVQSSTDWHTEFFPSGCLTETSDIFSLNETDEGKVEDISSIMFYLNFCSLGGEEGRVEVADSCASLLELGAPGLMLSFLTRNWKMASTGYSGGLFLKYLTRDLRADKVSEHCNFQSYWIPRYIPASLPVADLEKASGECEEEKSEAKVEAPKVTLVQSVPPLLTGGESFLGVTAVDFSMVRETLADARRDPFRSASCPFSSPSTSPAGYDGSCQKGEKKRPADEIEGADCEDDCCGAAGKKDEDEESEDEEEDYGPIVKRNRFIAGRKRRVVYETDEDET
jgi:hypothetical protein